MNNPMRNRKIGGLLVLLAAGFSGCMVGPKYTAPSVPLQPFHNQPSTTAQNTAPPLDLWWKGFDDPALTNVVERALKQNLSLLASLTRVEQARAVAREAGARLKPEGSLNAKESFIRQSPESPLGRASRYLPGFPRNQNYYDLGLAASWEADLFGSLRRGAQAATDEVQAAEAERVGTRILIAAEAADAYLQVRAAQTRLVYAKEQIATDEHLLELVSQRKNAGIAADREVAQGEALLFQAQASIPLLVTTLESQLNRLDVLMGAQPGSYAAELATVRDIPRVPAISARSEPSDLLRRRPDIIAAERRLAASNARIGQALAEYYPKISLSGVLGSQSLAPGHLFQDEGFQPVAFAGLRWRLFDFGRVDAEIKRERGIYAEALLQYRHTVLRAAEEVENALSDLAQSEVRQRSILQEIASLQRARDRSQESYTAGVTALTDVLDADRQLLTALDDLAVTRASAAQAAVHAFRSLGGGWPL